MGLGDSFCGVPLWEMLGGLFRYLWMLLEEETLLGTVESAGAAIPGAGVLIRNPVSAMPSRCLLLPLSWTPRLPLPQASRRRSLIDRERSRTPCDTACCFNSSSALSGSRSSQHYRAFHISVHIRVRFFQFRWPCLPREAHAPIAPSRHRRAASAGRQPRTVTGHAGSLGTVVIISYQEPVRSRPGLSRDPRPPVHQSSRNRDEQIAKLAVIRTTKGGWGPECLSTLLNKDWAGTCWNPA